MASSPSLAQPAAPRQALSAVDTAWLRMDDPTSLMMINGVLVLDGPVDFDQVRLAFEQRLAGLPRFRQRVVPAAGRGRPHWEDDPRFDLDWHVQRDRLADPGGDGELRELVSRKMSEPLDRERPLWQFHLVENYRGGAALIGRLHHCIGDGLALMMVVLSLTDISPEGAGDAAANPFCRLFRDAASGFAEARAAVERLMPEGLRLMEKPAQMLRGTKPWLLNLAATGAFGRISARWPDPRTVFKGPLGVEKRAAWSRAVPLGEVGLLQSALGGTINDVLLTAVAGGLGRYMVARGQSPAGIDIRATVPVSLRPLDAMHALGNHFGLVFLSLPVGISDPTARLAELRRRMTALKGSAESYTILKVLGVLGRVPYALQRLVVRIFGTKATAVMTNVPGPRAILYLAGQPISDMFFWVPQSGRLGLGISIMSYAGNVRLGVATDAGLVPDPEGIVAGFHQELAAMHRAQGGPIVASPSTDVAASTPQVLDRPSASDVA